MFIRRCHIISSPGETFVDGIDASFSRSEIGAVHRPLTRGGMFYLCGCESAGLAANEVIPLVCFVIRALEMGWVPKCSLNLISILTGDQF